MSPLQQRRLGGSPPHFQRMAEAPCRAATLRRRSFPGRSALSAHATYNNSTPEQNMEGQ